MSFLISLFNIQKNYILGDEKISVLQNINLTLEPGKMTCLLGESGCGKSTLLNIVGGLDTFDNGKYLFNGQDVNNFKEKDWVKFRKENIGFIFQNFNLISHLTALENVEMSMILKGLSKEDRKHRAKELLELVGLEDRMNYLPNRLSGGQKQRVAIARSLANDPDIILADEPTGALDSENSLQVMNLLKSIAEKGKIVLVVTHSKELSQIGDTIVSMNDGSIENIDCVVDENANNHSSVVNKDSIDKGNNNSKINLSTTLKLSYRNIKTKKWRSFLTAAGASIGIFGIAIIAALSNGIQSKISDATDGAILNTSINVAKEKNEFLDDKDVKKIKSLPKVKEVYAYNPYEISIKAKDNNKKVTGSAESLLPNKYENTYGKDYIKKGHYPFKKDDGILIPERLAEELFNKSTDAIGKDVEILVRLMSLKDIYQAIKVDTKIVGVIKNQSIPLMDTVGIPYEISQDVMKQSVEGKENVSLAFTVIPNSLEEIDKAKDQIVSKGYKAHTEEENSNVLGKYVSMAGIVLGMLSGISLIVSSIMIGVVLYISVLERTKEIGILKSIGSFKSDIRKIFITEGMMIGFMGGALGVFGAFLVGKIANLIIHEVNSKIDFELFQLTYGQIIFFILFSMFLGLLASFLPAFKASKLNPIDALRYE
ncbi:ATP-binding cassette domain-containing protein [Bacillus sp. NPDC060175]|uniref:ABC transporter ATP-binding protein/permease n=1 Tax=Bacillus sp. NPDC060175 TaxID=3347061 RepID=UPI0036601346